MNPIVQLTPSCGLKGKVSRIQLNSDVTSSTDTVRDVFTFLGVPYAAPPVNELRFKAPQPVSLWTGVRDATQLGAVCPQDFEILKILPVLVERPEKSSEDCLFLNVWTPTLDRNAKLPVMFWIHGGGYMFGFGDLPEGAALANFHDVVVISFNYRLGVFGFLCTGDSESTGNYGLLDTIEALKFVKQHAASFGGDPDNITIFGVSAGAVSVSLLSICPLAKGLFRRGICESGTYLVAGFLLQPQTAGKQLRQFLSKLPGFPPETASSAEIMTFLRSQPAESLIPLAAIQRPVLTEPFFPASNLHDLVRAPDAHCELLIGCNNDEGVSMFGIANMVIPGLTPDKLDRDTVRKLVRQQLITMIDEDEDTDRLTEVIMEEYGFMSADCQTPEDFHKALTEFYGDTEFVNGTVVAAGINSRSSKTYLYLLKHRVGFIQCPQWATTDHGSDFHFVFGIVLQKDFPSKPGFSPNADDVQLSRIMMSYWTNFAKTGNPNSDELVQWPQYDITTKQHLTLKLQPQVETHLKQNRIDFWSKTLPQIMVFSP